jgi:uncharacterized protein
MTIRLDEATAGRAADTAYDSTSPVRERIQALDVLRGVAVGGILFANVLVFFGLTFLSPERAAALSSTTADHVALVLERVFVDGKFYSVFSLLFGIGFGVQLARGGEAALPRFKRRLRILLGIGAIHAFFIWAGDILMLYALLGFTMPWFARKSDRTLVRWTVILLAIPTALYVVALTAWMLSSAGAAQTSPGGGMPANILPFFEAIGRGGLRDAFIGNLVFLAGRWADLFATVRFPKVLGMFVLGLWTVRTGLALSPSPGGLLGVAMQAVGIPMLALGYAATVALLVVDGRRFIGAFTPVGRMALTNYLMHSVICVTLSYGFGFGLWWRIGAAKAMAAAAAIIALQIPLSAWWLSRFRFGPAEWIWRRLTYGRPL